MALTQCPECGKDVSTEASVCPHCGYPINKKAFKEYIVEDIDKLVHERNRYSTKHTICGVIAGILFLTCIGFVIPACLTYQLEFIIFAIIFGSLAIVVLTVGGGINGTKYQNREKIISKYKKTHPEYIEKEGN